VALSRVETDERPSARSARIVSKCVKSLGDTRSSHDGPVSENLRGAVVDHPPSRSWE
jgi:hypothetical protein